MIRSAKALAIFFILAVFSIGANAQNKVIVIPMSGDDLKPLKNVLTVAKENGDFADPIAALISIGDTASESNPFLIIIAPGVYELDESLVMKEYVSISGSGQYLTKLTGTISSSNVFDGSPALIIGANNATISDLTIENVNGAGPVSGGISYTSSTTPKISDLTINVSGGNGEKYGIYIRSSSIISDVTITVSGGSIQTGVWFQPNFVGPVRIHNSAISASTQSVLTSPLAGSNITYIDNSILEGDTQGRNVCSFVILSNSIPLDKDCNPLPP